MKAEKTFETPNLDLFIENYGIKSSWVELQALKEYAKQLEAKAAKWDMIQWAIDSEVEFVEVEDGGDFEIALYSQDIDRLEELYKEREQING